MIYTPLFLVRVCGSIVRSKTVVRRLRLLLLTEMIARVCKHMLHATLCSWHAGTLATATRVELVVRGFLEGLIGTGGQTTELRKSIRDALSQRFPGCLDPDEKTRLICCFVSH